MRRIRFVGLSLVLFSLVACAESGSGARVDAGVVVVRDTLRSSDVALDPVPAGFEPAVDATDALALARQQLGGEVEPTAVHLYLGNRVNPPMTTVWVAVFDGVCVPGHGPPDFEGPACRSTSMGVTLDATTGDFIVAG